jgi:hypothetical protein
MRDRPSDRHRTIAERTLGRKLAPTEVVDHHNTDKGDNSPANLTPMPRGAHSRSHTNPRRRHLAKLTKALTMVRDGRKDY